MWQKIMKWWLFGMSNPTEKKGEAGAFKWRFRRYWLEIRTLSDNFRVRFTAAQNPYGYLYVGGDEQTQGFAERMYMVGMLLTTDQQFVDDIDRALSEYQERVSAQNPVEEDEKEEEVALAEMQALQEHIELPEKERRKVEKEIDRRLKNTVKTIKQQNHE